MRTIRDPNPGAIEVPDLDGDGYELWRWLRQLAEEPDMLGNFPSQTLAKCRKLAEVLEIATNLVPYEVWVERDNTLVTVRNLTILALAVFIASKVIGKLCS